MQEYKKTFRIPFSEEEIKLIEVLKEQACLRKTTFVTQKLTLALKEFEDRNQFGISLHFAFDQNNKVENPRYVQLYLDKSIYDRLKRYSDLTGMGISQFSKYLFMQAINNTAEEK